MVKKEDKMNESLRQSNESILSYVDIEHTQLSREGREAPRPKYKMDIDLAMMTKKFLEKSGKDPYSVMGLKRNPILESKDIKIDKFGEEKIIKPKEISDANFKEMERATSANWFNILDRVFNSELKHFPIRTESGRIRIAIPGCHLGFEVGGIIDFFNKQKIPVDIDAVDLEQAGYEKSFSRLEEREKIAGSKVNFESGTDAGNYFEGKETDILILRHPGPVFFYGQYLKWKQLVEKLLSTNPAMVLVSTYNHEIDDPEILKSLGKNSSSVVEVEVFKKILKESGYVMGPDSALFGDHRLQYPLSIYMNASEVEDIDRIKWQVPVDVLGEVYVNPNLIPVSWKNN